MHEDLKTIHYYPIRDYKYAHWFQDIQYNGVVLTETQRKEFVSVINETVDYYCEGLQMMHDELERIKGIQDDYHEISRTLYSIYLFVFLTMNDSMVASKYFIMADKDYDRRFMRGKLFVIANEGFKRLYGFDEKTYKKAEWEKLLPLMHYFPEVINRQFQDLTALLEKRAKSFTWWQSERNCEVHYKVAPLYKSRQEEIIESKVIMDSTKLFNALCAVNDFLNNAHNCLFNYIVRKYRRGEIAE